MKRVCLALLLLIWLSTVSAATAEPSVVCQGAGQPIYLIGGGPAFTTWNLTPIQEQLARHYKVCRWDMRGVGDNAAIGIAADTPVLTQWLQDMAMILPNRPVVLWGHSWGALQAMLFTRQHPDRVRALVLNNPVDPGLKSLDDIELKRHVHPYVESQLRIDDIGTAAEARHRFRSKIASYFLDAEQGWSYSAAFSAQDTNNALNVRIWEEYRQVTLDSSDMAVLAPKISKAIFCQQDVLMPESLNEYTRLVPSLDHVMLADCAHFPWIESPDAFYDVLLLTVRAVMP